MFTLEREEAFKIMKKHITNKNLQKHCLATEIVMKYLARHFGEDEAKWALAGLLHDIDYEQTADDPKRHSLVGAGMLEEMGLAEDLVYAVKVHMLIDC